MLQSYSMYFAESCILKYWRILKYLSNKKYIYSHNYHFLFKISNVLDRPYLLVNLCFILRIDFRITGRLRLLFTLERADSYPCTRADGPRFYFIHECYNLMEVAEVKWKLNLHNILQLFTISLNEFIVYIQALLFAWCYILIVDSDRCKRLHRREICMTPWNAIQRCVKADAGYVFPFHVKADILLLLLRSSSLDCPLQSPSFSRCACICFFSRTFPLPSPHPFSRLSHNSHFSIKNLSFSFSLEVAILSLFLLRFNVVLSTCSNSLKLFMGDSREKCSVL